MRTRTPWIGSRNMTVLEVAMTTLALTFVLSCSSSTMALAFSPMSASAPIIGASIGSQRQPMTSRNMIQAPCKGLLPKSASAVVSSSTTLYSSTTSTLSSNQKNYKPVFDFMNAPNDASSPSHPINKFDRIDDAIMGGISTSSVRAVSDHPYCSWSGICREFGGGFCGMRTLPFVEPLPVVIGDNNDEKKDADGLFVTCRLTSDNEPQRRVWKMTIRTDSSRGELVYQSEFKIPNSANNSTSFPMPSSSDQEWNTVHVPFSSFRQVRGPRLVPNGGEPLNVTNGLYQIGMTMSKFQMSVNTTEVKNFRSGFFELQIQQIGLYSDNENKKESEILNGANINTLQTVTKDEMMKQRPFIFKIAIIISKIFFSEQANRRKLAMNLLRTKRNMTRLSAILFGLRFRRQSYGLLPSIGKAFSILAIDSFRTVLGTILKYGLFKPLQLVRKVIVAIMQMIKKGGGKAEGSIKKA